MLARSDSSELHCDYLIHFNTDVLTARPLPKKKPIFNTVCLILLLCVCTAKIIYFFFGSRNYDAGCSSPG